MPIHTVRARTARSRTPRRWNYVWARALQYNFEFMHRGSQGRASMVHVSVCTSVDPGAENICAEQECYLSSNCYSVHAMRGILPVLFLLCALPVGAVKRKRVPPSSTEGLGGTSDLIRQKAEEMAAEFERKVGHECKFLCLGDSLYYKLVVDAVDFVTDYVDDMPRQFHFLEVFCGSGRATERVRSMRYSAVGIDKQSGRDFDNITTLVGFFYLALHVLCVWSGGTVWFSPQCSTWGNMARSWSKRSTACPYGDTSRFDIVEANYCALIMWEGGAPCAPSAR
eukprot:9189588-Pyramimonas_sp.AAC.1